ncbi:MAG: hypothetical protein H0V40_04505 [Actinobacteria bacterium]|nr:hypothetical protein [Actinomycetota bacterium]
MSQGCANAIRLAARGVEQDVVAPLGERLAQVPGARRSGTAHAPARERMRQT